MYVRDSNSLLNKIINKKDKILTRNHKRLSQSMMNDIQGQTGRTDARSSHQSSTAKFVGTRRLGGRKRSSISETL